MIITTERLHYLWAVAETGSFSAAGRRLGVSGAAVQQVIRHFEQDLDAPLFRRSPGRSPVLTDLGRQFYFHALDIIPRLEGLENLAATRGQGQEGQLRIGLHGFVMFPEVRAALVELQQAFPLLEIFLYDGEDSVLHCDKLRQLDSSARHTVDILLAPARLRYDHGGQSVMAGRIIWRVVAAADHPLSRIRGSLSLDDLLRHRQLLPLPGVISSDAFYDSFRLSSHLVHYSQFYQLQEMLLAGMGFAVFPAQLALWNRVASSCWNWTLTTASAPPRWSWPGSSPWARPVAGWWNACASCRRRKGGAEPRRAYQCLPTVMPRKRAAKPRMVWAPILNSSRARRVCPRAKESKIRDEKVVNDPMKPTRMIRRTVSEMSRRTAASSQISPNRKQPSTLTTKVPSGYCRPTSVLASSETP